MDIATCKALAGDFGHSLSLKHQASSKAASILGLTEEDVCQ